MTVRTKRGIDVGGGTSSGGGGGSFDFPLPLAGIREHLEYMRDVFMTEQGFNSALAGHEVAFTMEGDDLAGFCWHFNELIKAFAVKTPRERMRTADG